MAATMNPKFQASVHNREDVTYVKLAGVIDEDNELASLVTRSAAAPPSSTSRRSSASTPAACATGSTGSGKVEKNGAKVVLVECSPAIVAQINLVNNFTGQGVVKSFYVPYFCPECDVEKVLLVETRDMGAARRSRRRRAAATSAMARWTSTTWRTPTSRSCRTRRRS